ncbi:hypothetical protein ACP4OV_023271 [Aristida adscensionis]
MDCLDSIDHFLRKKRKENCIDDSDWVEVKIINGYAVLMGYLLMGVRGLGILVVTWTTVVLLGGFVSVLGKIDFWCLTGITLVQTAGVFNFLLEEKLSDILHSSWGLLGAVFATVLKWKRPGSSKKNQDPSSAQEEEEELSSKRIALAYVLSFIQLVMLAVILCPLAVMYMLGLYISTGVSLWRLIKHDFGNGDGSANLKPALEVLYSLAVAQGVLFGYKTIHAFGAKIGLADFVADICSVDKKVVSDYLVNIVEGCEKDPSFATGRNLITYAVNLMLEPKSNDYFIVGVSALGTIIKNDKEWGHPVLAKHLLTRSASSSHMIHRLLETLGPRSPYSTEIRQHAARIIFLVAGSMYLEQLPRGIQCISSLLDISEPPQGYYWPDSSLPKEYERAWLLDGDELGYQISREKPKSDSESPESDSKPLQGYARLVIQGLRILQKLIVDEDNQKVISNTEGLLSKVAMAPLISDKLHMDHHEEWNSIAEESQELMAQLMAAHGGTGTKPQWEISSRNSKAIIITTLEVILCQECEALKQRHVIEILLNLSVDDTSDMKDSENNSSRMFTWIVLLTYLLAEDFFDENSSDEENSDPIPQTKKSGDIRKLAGEKLQAIQSLQGEGSDMSMLQSVRVVLDDITRTLVDYDENSTNRVHAAQILEHLCRNYTKDDEYLMELKNTMVKVMPKVLEETLGYLSTRGEIQVVIEANDDKPSSVSTDLNKGGVFEGNGQENISSHQQNGEQHEGSKLHEALVSLCVAVRFIWIDRDPDLTSRFNEIAERVCSEQEKPVKNFFDLVEEIKELLEKMKAEESANAPSSSSG